MAKLIRSNTVSTSHITNEVLNELLIPINVRIGTAIADKVRANIRLDYPGQEVTSMVAINAYIEYLQDALIKFQDEAQFNALI